LPDEEQMPESDNSTVVINENETGVVGDSSNANSRPSSLLANQSSTMKSQNTHHKVNRKKSYVGISKREATD
jgi:hypothetical protein